jgi:hypothetical protein
VPKGKLLIAFSFAAVLGIMAAAMSFAGGTRSVAVSSSDPDLLLPSTNIVKPANWQPAAVKAAPVNVPWANLKVNSDSTDEAQNEPYIAVDPKNAQHLVVAANSWQAGNGQFEVYVYASFDGGRTWSASQPYINRNASRLNGADPTVAFGADGAVYASFVAFSPADGAVAVSRSVDGGRTWASQSWATSFVGGAADKPALVAGNAGLYLFWQGSGLFARMSQDNGATWGTASLVDSVGRNAAPVVTQNGVTVFYTRGNNLMAATPFGKSVSDGPVLVSAVTPLQARPTHYRASVYPTAGVDARGTLYVAWADGRNLGRGNDILISRSADGAHWSSPAVVNNDSGRSDQLMPALSVSADGAVTVAWLDNRNDANNYNYDVYLARASDGVNFSNNQRVTSVSSNPDNDWRTGGTMIGDYFALATGAGVAYPVWTDTRNGNQDIFLAPVAVPQPSSR